MLALASIPAFSTPGGNLVAETLIIAGAFLLAAPPTLGFWALIGRGAALLLRTPATLRAFNVAMALLLVLSLIPVLG
jgi:threonine/homoserine/homoserine lactone efflux protein